MEQNLMFIYSILRQKLQVILSNKNYGSDKIKFYLLILYYIVIKC